MTSSCSEMTTTIACCNQKPPGGAHVVVSGVIRFEVAFGTFLVKKRSLRDLENKGNE